MKRLMALLLVLMQLFSCAYAASGHGGVYLNGTELRFVDENGAPLEPVLLEGRLYAPSEALGQQLYYRVQADPQQLTLDVGGQQIPAAMVGDVVYIPVLLFAMAAGYEVALDGTDYLLTNEAARDYQAGEAELKAGAYDAACAAFAKAGEFADAAARIRETRYIQAEALLAQERYDAAVEAFGLAGDYQDAAERIGECWYLQGQKLFAQGNVDGASAAYQKAGAYKDAASLAVSVYTDDGLRMLNSGDLKSAYNAFAGVTGSDIGRQYLKEVLYRLAKQKSDEGQTEMALALYQLMSGYSDAATRLSELYYTQASACEAAGQYANAISSYKLAGDYQDAQNKWRQLTYEEGKKLQASQKYEEAYLLFDTIRGYSDVNNRLTNNVGLKNAAQKRKRAELVAGIQKGDTVRFGSYAHVESGSSRKQTIEWQVLKVDGSRLLLLSRYVLEKKPYHTTNTKTINWSNCSLRTWLNGTFLQNAFTQSERNAIVSTSLSSKNTGGKTVSTSDKVFLPTYYELVNNLEKEERKSRTKKGVAVVSWTRDRYTGMSSSSTAYANTISASADSSYQKVTNSMYVRPAIWVNLEANYDWSAAIAQKSGTEKSYKAIENLMAKGDYQQALQKLNKETSTDTVKALMRECRYQLGCEALRCGDLATAAQFFSYIKNDDYLDTVTLLAVIELLK